MRTRFPTPTALLALLVCATASAAGAVPSALASTDAATGGAPAGGQPSSSGAKANVHPTGIATWFGPGLYGQQTACGQTLTPAVVGVANRTLPCGTLVQVTYRGHSLVLPVLDRGPYANHADWDLTASAAQKLAITETVHIATRVVGSAPNNPSLGSPPVTPAEVATGGAQAG